MTAGPEIARLVRQFEESTTHTNDTEKSRHHEQTETYQRCFQKDLEKLVTKMSSLGNPFTEESSELLNISTKAIANEDVVTAVTTAKEKGQASYLTFLDERLQKIIKLLSDPIQTNRIPLFSNQNKSLRKIKDLKLKTAKSNCNLFARLYIGCQARGGDLNDFFEHENQSFPPSLSYSGDLRPGNKADLLRCFETNHDYVLSEPKISAIVIDGAVLVHLLKPGQAKTFQEYNENVFLPRIASFIEKADRIDIVWDCYRDEFEIFGED